MIEQQNKGDAAPIKQYEYANNQRYVVYPYQIIQTDKKLQQAQKLLFKIMQESYEKQIKEKNGRKSTQSAQQSGIYINGNSYNQIQANSLQNRLKQDELVNRNIQYIEKCRLFYQNKLSQQRGRYKQIIKQNRQRMRNFAEQLIAKQQQIQKHEKQAHTFKQQIKKLHSQSQQIKSKRNTQKDRITQMFFKQKQELFNKYTKLEKQSMILLDFANKIEDIIQKKSLNDDQNAKLSCIKEIQLQASNFYANLSIPVIQEILNIFTQDFNYLYRKFQKKDRNDNTDKNQRASKISLKKLKQYKIQHSNSFIQNQSQQMQALKQQLSDMQKHMQQKIKQFQHTLQQQTQKSKNLKKKYQIQINKYSKQIENHYQKQEDLKKKINSLEKQILDHQNKIKIQNQQIEIFQKRSNHSLHSIISQNSQQINPRSRIKSQLLNMNPTHHQQTHKQHILAQQTASLRQEIQNLVKQMNIFKNKLQQKQLQIQNNHKYINQQQQQINNKIQQKQLQLKTLQQTIQHKDRIIKQLQQKLRYMDEQVTNKDNILQYNQQTIQQLTQQLQLQQQYTRNKKQQSQQQNNIISTLQNNNNILKQQLQHKIKQLNDKCEAINALQDDNARLVTSNQQLLANCQRILQQKQQFNHYMSIQRQLMDNVEKLQNNVNNLHQGIKKQQQQINNTLAVLSDNIQIFIQLNQQKNKHFASIQSKYQQIQPNTQQIPVPVSLTVSLPVPVPAQLQQQNQQQNWKQKQKQKQKQRQVQSQVKELKNKQSQKQKSKQERQVTKMRRKIKQMNQNTSFLQKQVFQLATKLEQRTKGYDHFKQFSQRCQKQILHLQNKYKTLKNNYTLLQQQQSKSQQITNPNIDTNSSNNNNTNNTNNNKNSIQYQLISNICSIIVNNNPKIDQKCDNDGKNIAKGQQQCQTQGYLQQLQKQLTQKNKILQEQQHTIQQKIRIIYEHKMTLSKNQQQVQNKHEVIQKLRQQIEQKTILIHTMEQQINTIRQCMEANANQLHISEIQKELQNKINVITQQSRTFKDKYHQVCNQYQIKLKQNKLLLTNKTHECDILQHQVSRLTDIINNTNKQTEEIKKKLDTIQKQNNSNPTITNMINKQPNNTQQIQKTISKLKEQIKIKEQRLIHLQQQYNNLNQILIGKDQQLRILKQQNYKQKWEKQKKQNVQLLNNNLQIHDQIKVKQEDNIKLNLIIHQLTKQNQKYKQQKQNQKQIQIQRQKQKQGHSLQKQNGVIIQKQNNMNMRVQQQVQVELDMQNSYINQTAKFQQQPQQQQLQVQKQQQKQLKCKQKVIDSQIQFMQIQNNLNTTQNQLQQNLISSKQLNIMQQEIIGFKVQLNGLLDTIHQKDIIIAHLKQQLSHHNHNLTNNSNSKHQNVQQTLPRPSNKQQNTQNHIQKLKEKIIQKQRQLQIANIRHTKNQYLTCQIAQLQHKLDGEKQLYQNQLNKCHMRIIQLQSQIRKFKQQEKSGKRRVFSEEYHSLDPRINNFDSKPKTNQKGSNNLQNVAQNWPQDNKSQQYHSLEDDSHQQPKPRTQQQIQMEQKEQKEQKHQSSTLIKFRREKSQEYARTKAGLIKLQKLASIQRRYDKSDQKSKQQKQMKAIVPMRSQDQSPLINNNNINQQNKFFNSLKVHKQKQQLKNHPPVSGEDMQQVSEYGVSQMIRSLSQQNRQLKLINEKLSIDLSNMLQFIQIISKRWKNNKKMQNNSGVGSIIGLQILQQNIKLLQIRKQKILQQFSPHDLQSLFDNVFQLVKQTKRWVDLIEKLTSQNKKMNLELMLNKNFPKLAKTKTTKYGVGAQQQHRRSRSVYSQGNVYRQHHIDMDQYAFQIQQQHPQPQRHNQHLQPETHNNLHQQIILNNPPLSSLEILFGQNNQMSQISSVKHNSLKSQFLNSRSQIAKIFQKQKLGIEHRQPKKQTQNKRDIIDEFLVQNQKPEKVDKQKQKIQKQRQKFERQRQKFQKNKNNNISTIQNISSSTNKIYQSRIHTSIWHNSPHMQKNNQIQAKRVNKFQQKSNKAKTDFLIMLYKKLQRAKKQTENNKKQYTQFIKDLIQKNQANIKHIKTQFERALNKIILNSQYMSESSKSFKNSGQVSQQTLKKPSSKGSLPGRISQKDEQMYQRLQQMQIKIESRKKQIQEKQRIIQQVKQQVKQLDKKLKQEKASHQSTKKKYASQTANSNYLRLRIQKIQTDFRKFIQKVSKQNLPGVQNFQILTSQAQAQANILKQQPQPLQKGKTFLKGKKIANAQTQPQIQQNKAIVFNTCKSFTSQKMQEQSVVNSYNITNPTPNEIIQKAKQNDKQTAQIQEKRLKRSISLISSPQKQQKTIQQPIKVNQKKEQYQNESFMSRIKSEPLTVKQKQKRLSDKTDKSSGQNGKKNSIAQSVLSKFLQKNNTIKKKKSFSQETEEFKVKYYEAELKEIYTKLKQALQNTPLKWIDTKQKENDDKQSQRSQKQQSQMRKPSQSMINSKIKRNTEQDQNQQKLLQIKQQFKARQSIQQIKKILEKLQQNIKDYQRDMEKSIKQREDRLKETFKEIINSYKISSKTINKIIDKKQKQKGNSVYINPRLFFKNLYLQFKASRTSTSDNGFIQQDNFQAFEDKFKILVEQNKKIKKQLQQKVKQCQNLKNQINSNDNPKYLQKKSLTSNQNQQNFHDFQYKQLFDNTKPSFELLQQLRKDLNTYKKKCQQYQAINNKKKKQNLKYIRKWQ